MIELESSRARRYPLSANDKNSSSKNFDPRLQTGWQSSDPTLIAKIYQKTKEELEKWLNVRAALLGLDLTSESKFVVDVN